MSFGDDTQAMQVPPSEDEGESRRPKVWWLLGALVLLLGGVGIGVVVATSSDTSSVEAQRANRSEEADATSTTTTTRIESSTPPPADDADAQSSVTTTSTVAKKAGTPAAGPLPDEPTFTTVSFPSTFQCVANGGAGQVPISWQTTDATVVVMRVQGTLNYTKNFTTASVSTTVTVSCSISETVHVQLQAQGPGGNAVAVRQIAVSKP